MIHLLATIGMIFTQPLAVAALAGTAASIPIVIHLLNRKRYVVVNWAAMRFLLAAQKKNTRRLKVEQWLLLLTRVMMGIVLVVMMASVLPAFERLWQTLFPSEAIIQRFQGRTHHLIVIDGSYTMTTRREDERTRFEHAKEIAKEIVTTAQAGDRFSLYYLTNPMQSIITNPADDRDKVLREIDQLNITHGSADVIGALKSIADSVNKPLGTFTRREVYFVTDARRTAWPIPTGDTTKPIDQTPLGTLTASAAWGRIFANAAVNIIDVANKDDDNIAITSLSLSDGLPMINQDLAVTVQLQLYGKQARDKVPVELLLGRVQDRHGLKPIAQKLIDIQPNTNVNVTFSLDRLNRIKEPGTYLLQVRVGEDRLSVDNVRSMVIQVRDSVPVMVVNGKQAVEPLERASEFLKRALNPFPENERTADSHVKITNINAREFQDAGIGNLFKPDSPTEVVFLCDLPTISSNEVARLHAHLKRGGSVVVSLGPNAGKNLEAYNRVLFDDGKGLLPGPLTSVRRATANEYFSLTADEEAFKQPPLNAFRSEQERGSFSTPQFNQYVRMELPPNTAVRRIFTFSSSAKTANTDKLEPAILEYPKHRGRMVLITSSLNTDWNEWPRTLSYVPFIQELLRMCVSNQNRLTVAAGEPVEQYLSPQFVGLSAELTRIGDADFSIEPVTVNLTDEAGLVRYPHLDLSGVYRVNVGGKWDSLFAVNVPLISPTGGSEADLKRLTKELFTQVLPEADLQMVTSLNQIQRRSIPTDSQAESLLNPRGPSVARILGFCLLGLLVIESLLAYQYGSCRAGVIPDPSRVKPKRWTTALWAIPLLLALCCLAVLIHSQLTGQFLGFLSFDTRQMIEEWFGIPAAGPGEGTRWRIETRTMFSPDLNSNAWLVGLSFLIFAAIVCWVYRRENFASPATPLTAVRQPIYRLVALRCIMGALLLWLVLPQTQLAFERESWPDVVVMIDDSRSMSIVDEFHDTEVKTAAERLKKEWASIAKPSIDKLLTERAKLQTRLTNSPPAQQQALQNQAAELDAQIADFKTPHRLNLIKALLLKDDAKWLKTIVDQRQMRVHLYRASTSAVSVIVLDQPDAIESLQRELLNIRPIGEASFLASSVNTVMKSFRGNSLNALIMFTDGISIGGDDWLNAAKQASRAGVPLHLIGVGDAAETTDAALIDFRSEDTINLNDRLIIQGKIQTQGPNLPDSIPVILKNITDGQNLEIAREVVRLNQNGKPSTFKFVHQPKKTGEQIFVIEVPKLPEETDVNNNRIEHRVFVSEAKKLRLLLVEGYPRYDYRYLKNLFERQTDNLQGVKSIELDVYLTSAQADAPKQDRSLIGRFPTTEELKKYDMIIVGDVDFKLMPKGDQAIDSIAKFVKDHGGGLLLLAGEHANPHAYRDTPLVDLLPVICEGPSSEPTEQSIKETYRPRLTNAGQSHPLFRFSSEENENLEIWNRLTPLYWYAKNYRRKLSAEVLAVHPDRPAEGAGGTINRDENHPLVLQHFVGSGRVLFIGFDDTWRWRLLQDEPRFNQFWLQATRTIARGRVGRIEVRTDRKAYRRDEPIRVTVRYPDEIPVPAEPVKVTLSRLPLAQRGPNAEIDTQTIELNLKEGTRGTFESLITSTPEGDYQFTVNDAPNTGIRPKAEAKVYPPPGEMDRLRLNDVELKRAARDSAGKYYSLSEAESIPDELPSGVRIALDQPSPPWQIWNHEAMLGLLLSLWTAEWIMRKRWRLL